MSHCYQGSERYHSDLREALLRLHELATSPKDEYLRVFFECFDLAVMSIHMGSMSESIRFVLPLNGL